MTDHTIDAGLGITAELEPQDLEIARDATASRPPARVGPEHHDG